MKSEKQIKVRESLASSIRRIFEEAERQFSSHKEMCDKLDKLIYSNEKYKKLPNYQKSFLNCVRDTMYNLHWKFVEFSYIVQGKRLLITSEEYKKIDPVHITQNCLKTGKFVYIKNPEKEYT